jgi:hypothetical protein
VGSYFVHFVGAHGSLRIGDTPRRSRTRLTSAHTPSPRLGPIHPNPWVWTGAGRGTPLSTG